MTVSRFHGNNDFPKKLHQLNLLEFVFLSKADLIAITETWLTPDDVAVRREVTPSGYKIIDFPRIVRREGGRTLLHKTGLVIDGPLMGL